jgi:hypothetical protein
MLQPLLLDLIPVTRKVLKDTLYLIEEHRDTLDPLSFRNFFDDCPLTIDEILIIEVILRNIEGGNTKEKAKIIDS